jgi:hypothetical protein
MKWRQNYLMKKYTHINKQTGELAYFNTKDPLYPIPSDTQQPLPYLEIPKHYKPVK